MISTGMQGTPFQSSSPKRARRIRVKTLTSVIPPRSRTQRHARTSAGCVGEYPAIFKAK